MNYFRGPNMAKHGATGNKQHSEEEIQMKDSWILKCKAILESLESTKCFMRVPQVIVFFFFFVSSQIQSVEDSGSILASSFGFLSQFKWLQTVAVIKLGFSVPQMIFLYAPTLPLNHSWSKTPVVFFVLFCFSNTSNHHVLRHIRHQRWVTFTALGIKAVAAQQYFKTLMWLTARSIPPASWLQQLTGTKIIKRQNWNQQQSSGLQWQQSRTVSQ